MRTFALLCVVLGGGCGRPANGAMSGTPQSLYGEVHVHGFDGGSHPSALFVAAATPAARVDGDDIVAEPPADAVAGTCRLTLGSCSRCPTQPPAIDGGTVHITGGRGIGDVELRFTDGIYLPVQQIGAVIFDGGETLTFDGDGATAPAFHGTLLAPAPLMMRVPPASRIGAGDFVVGWVPDVSTRIDITLVASTSDGRIAIVECTADDAAGQTALPASLLSAMPPPPRDLQLLVSRDIIAFQPSVERGLGVVTHAGFETVLRWHEDP